MKTSLLVAVSAVLFGQTAALAEDCDSHQAAYVQPQGGYVQPQGYVHGQAPVGQAYSGGHYEMRPTQVYVAGRFIDQPVEQCRRHGWRQVCFTRIERQWVAGHYETQQNWVWVANFGRHHHEGFGAHVDFRGGNVNVWARR